MATLPSSIAASRLALRCLFFLLLAVSSIVAGRAADSREDLALCEQKTRDFLAADYLGDDAVAGRFMTRDLARLWRQAINPPAGETILWDADPILETNDLKPELVKLGPGLGRNGLIEVPVVYRPAEATAPYTKTFVFTKVGKSWLISDIMTSGSEFYTGSELARLKSAFGS